MVALKEGSKAPDFTLPADGGKDIALKDFRGKTVVLYFYPKDDTSGCTAEACGFRDTLPRFKKLKAVVLGVSKDDVKKHDKFRDKYELNFPLLSDAEGAVCEAYGTWIEKSMYGRKYMGIDRATFLIDGQGVIRQIWRKVKVPGHVEEVADAIAGLDSKAA
jgi:peroxiredoxin Q/BCP